MGIRVRLDHIIWGTTGVIFVVSIATQTNIIKNLVNKVRTRGQGFGYDCGSGFDPITQLQDMQLQSQQQPNYTQPLVTPEQARKNTEHHHKQKKQQEQVYAQIECPDDPNTLPCGSNCYHDGKLWKTVCSQMERDELYPAVIPEEHGTQNNIHPTTPDQNLQNQLSQYNPYQPSYQQPSPSQGNVVPAGGKQECRVVNLKSHGHRDTCRWNFNVIPQVGANDYMIDVDVTLGNSWNKDKDSQYPKDNPRLEITSGGPGSHDKTSCCGFSLCVNCRDGTLHIETEDWSQGGSTGTVYLDKGASISGGRPIFGQTVHMRWVYQSDTQGNVYYWGYAQLQGSQPVYFPVITNPTSPGLHGLPLIPGQFAPGTYLANDPSRVRVDAAGCCEFNGGPTVTVLGMHTYQG